MKKYLILFIICNISNLVLAQVSLGKNTANGTSTILDFYDNLDNTKGIILPAVDNTLNALASDQTLNNGTFLFDKSDKKIKMFENNVWVDLTDEGSITQLLSQTLNENLEEQGVIIGNDTTNAKGILVLEEDKKALILPKIPNPHINVKSPYPGMMCYDTETLSLAIYDGKFWNFWK